MRAGTADRAFLGHPLGLAVLAFTEAWERFSYYGMQTLLVLYMVDRLLRPGHAEHVPGLGVLRGGIEAVFGPQSVQSLASQIFGLYTAAVYLTPVAGSFLADRWLGRTRAISIGAVMMAAGHFCMAFEAGFIPALLLLVGGCGLVKGNIAAQVGGLYAAGDPRRSDAFQVFVLAINVGVTASPLVCGSLGELVGWDWGFGAAGVGMVIGLGIYLAGRGTLPPDPPRGAAAMAVILAAPQRRAVAALLVLIPVLGFAFVGNNEIYNVFLVWARENVSLSVRGRSMPVTWLLSFDTISCMAALPLSVAMWRALAARGIAPHELTKIAGGALLCALACLVLAAGAAWQAGAGGRLPLWVPLLFQLMNMLGYIHIYPVGLALVSRAAPQAVNATMVGVFYLLFLLANLLVGWLGAFYEAVPHAAFWMVHVACVGGAAAVMMVFYRPLRRALG